MLTYPAMLPGVSEEQLGLLAGLIAAHRRRIGARWRRLSPPRQALLVLAYLRKNETVEALAAGFGVGAATAWRYVQEGIALLAGRAPSLAEALWLAAWSGSNFVFVDGTVVPIDRVRGVPDPPAPTDEGKGRLARARAAKARAEQQRRRRLKGQIDPAPVAAPAVSSANLNRLYYSGKHKRHVVTLQALVDPHGRLTWISAGLPGSVQDLAAAERHGLLHASEQAGLYLVADLAYTGAGPHVLTGYRRTPGRERSPGQTTANRALASLRATCEHAFAPFKRWRILQHARCCPRRIGHIAKAIHTLLTCTNTG